MEVDAGFVMSAAYNEGAIISGVCNFLFSQESFNHYNLRGFNFLDAKAREVGVVVYMPRCTTLGV